MTRRSGGFIGQDGLDAPDPPTGVSASGVTDRLAVAFTAPTDVGTSAITGFVAVANEGSGGTGTSSPVDVGSLVNGTSYTFRAYAVNAYGTSAASDVSGSATSRAAARILISGGKSTSGYVNMEYVAESTEGTWADFGDSSDHRYENTAGNLSSATRGVFWGGADSSGLVNVIDYVTMASLGAAADFGNTGSSPSFSAGHSNGTIGIVIAGQNAGGTMVNSSQVITIASTGNASTWTAGDPAAGTDTYGTTSGVNAYHCGFGSTTRMCVAGGFRSSAGINIIEYFTMSTAAAATDFGDLTRTNLRAGGASNNTRGIIAGGELRTASSDAAKQNIDFVTIATTGDAADFGDLTGNVIMCMGWSGAILGGVTGGTPGGASTTYINFTTQGDGTDWADTHVGRDQGGASVSTNHGGIA